MLSDVEEELGKPQLQLGFMCFLVDQRTNEHFVVSVCISLHKVLFLGGLVYRHYTKCFSDWSY